MLALPDALTKAFSAGVSAYDRGDFGAAEQLFARVALRVPRAADAWANYGTAAWASGDSAVAARGWQRALRLDPLDDETRTRLSLLQPASLRAPAYVAPVPVDAVALVALALWVGAWLALAIPPHRRPAATRSVAGGAIALAVLALAATLELRDRVEARDLGVVRSTGVLRDAPSESGAQIASAGAGETGALGAREGLWVRVTLDAGRAGWMPAAGILPLD
jgi:tetratricopeptide (TPR) repeat protein